MTSNAKWLKLRREKLDQDAAWIAAQRASLDEIEDASVEAEVALAKVIETRAVADEARAVNTRPALTETQAHGGPDHGYILI